VRSQPQKDRDEKRSQVSNEAAAKHLKTRLEAACDGLWWSSESDYPVEVVWQATEDDPPTAPETIDEATNEPIKEPISETTLRKLANLPVDSPIQIADVEDFFKRQITPHSWHTAEEKSQCARLSTLKDLLTAALPNLQVYCCGEVEIKAYVIGNAIDGSIAGIKTILVQT